jgi:hypothetical protein
LAPADRHLRECRKFLQLPLFIAQVADNFTLAGKEWILLLLQQWSSLRRLAMKGVKPNR